MKLILKDYLKSFFSSLITSISTIIYLIILSLTIFVLSTYSIQEFSFYHSINKNSSSWNDSFYNDFVHWNFDKFGNDENAAAKFFSELKISSGEYVLNSHWWETVIYQIASTKSDADSAIAELNIGHSLSSLSYTGIKEDRFNSFLNSDILKLKLFEGSESENDYKEKELGSTKTFGVSTKIEDFLSDSNFKKVYATLANNNYQILNYYFANFKVNNLGSVPIGANDAIIENNYNDYSYSEKHGPIDTTTLPKNNIYESLIFTPSQNNLRNNISNVFVTKGRMPRQSREILVNEAIAKSKGWKIGDKIHLFGNPTNYSKLEKDDHLYDIYLKPFTIVGYGMSYYTSTTRLVTTSSNLLNSNVNNYYGNIYLYNSDYRNLELSSFEGISKFDSAAENIIIDSDYSFYWNKLDNKNHSLKFDVEKQGVLTNDNFRMNSSDGAKYDLISGSSSGSTAINAKNWQYFSTSIANDPAYKAELSSRTNIILTIVLMMFSFGLSFIFINFVIKKDMNNSRKQLGIFKSMGYKNGELSWVFSTRILLTFISCIIFGYLLSIPLQIYINGFFTATNNVNVEYFTDFLYNPRFLAFMFVLVPTIFATISFCLNYYYIKQSATSLLFSTNKVKNLWLLKFFNKFASKSSFYFRMQISITVQNLFKWFIVVIIFLLSLTLLLVQGTVVKELNGSFSSLITGDVYSNKVQSAKQTLIANNYKDTSLGLGGLKYIKTPNTINLDPKNNLYQDQNDPNVQTEINDSIGYWYWVISSSSLPTILSSTIFDHPYMTSKAFDDLVSILPSSLKTQLEYFAHFLNYQTGNKNGNTILSFNKILYNSKYELPWLHDQLVSNLFNTYLGSSHNSIFGIQNSNDFNSFFNKNGLSQSEINTLFNDKTIRTIVSHTTEVNTLPIVVSELTAKLMNLHVGQIINSNYQGVSNSSFNQITLFSGSKKTGGKLSNISNFNLKIDGIMNKNVFSNNMYTTYKDLADFYVDNNNKSYTENDLGLANNIASYNNLSPNAKSLKDLVPSNVSDAYFNINNYPFYSWDASGYDPSLTLENFLTHFGTSVLNDNSIPMFTKYISPKNYITQLNNTVHDINIRLEYAQWINIILSILMISILLLICMAVILDESEQIIATFKAEGYNKHQINWLIIGNYVVGVIFAAILSIVTSIYALKAIQSLLFNKSKILMNLSLNPWISLIIFGLVITVLWISWIICSKMIDKKTLQELFN